MCPNPQETADLVTFAEEIRNGKLHFGAVSHENTIHLTLVQIFHLKKRSRQLADQR